MSPTVSKNNVEASLRVAVVFDDGRIKPVWFEFKNQPAKERIFIKEICSTWTYMEGTTKIFCYAVSMVSILMNWHF